ncbi:hypothetical protein BGZ61DRAFT_51365 [Ilyonectria robusta]|uniref:uncharacterized protein n=1 Tax=Ilyonectria robusta TaxID=1079257 RepID=UPI001E8DA3A2|nr:uncharacterized protein BGZ61DRAFT_51365 [Ilyonectria robusta]KAH8686233.1 hypothetical protein BGZ61DRAFT_51365 [Ilyonectria robusta]
MEAMNGNSITELGIPRLIESTSILYKTLEDHVTGSVTLDTPKELHDEVAEWMRLLEHISQVQIPGSGLENKLHEGQNLFGKYATTLFDINIHLEISKRSMDPEKSSWARDELYTLRRSLQEQRGDVERWMTETTVVPTYSEGTMRGTYLDPQPMDLRVGAILRDAPKVQLSNRWKEGEPNFQHGSPNQQTWGHSPDVPERQRLQTPAPEPTEQQQSWHSQMMEKAKCIATGMEEMGLHLNNLNKFDISAHDSTQSRGHLTTLFDQTKEDFWKFLQDFHDLEAKLATEGPAKEKQRMASNSTQTGHRFHSNSELRKSVDSTNSANEWRQFDQTRDSPRRLSYHQSHAVESREIHDGDGSTIVAPLTEMALNGTHTIDATSTIETFLTALPETHPMSPIVSDRESEALVLKYPSFIGVDSISKAIIEKDTRPFTKSFSQIVGGSLGKTGLELGVLEVDGSNWVAQFCDTHRYLCGILIAITVPKDLFLWHTRHFPVDSDTWTKGALVRTMSIVTEPPRYLHSYPLRHGRNLSLSNPNFLLHWNLEDIKEPHVSARFKELVQVGGELQKRVGSFSYKQLVVCITIPWWICYKDTSGDRKQAMEFLERMGIVGAIPVNEKSDGGVRKTLWCPSRIKLGGSDQSVHAFLQETTFTGSPELQPAISATPTRFVVVTVRRGHVSDWVDAVQYALGMDSKTLRYSVPTKEPISFSQLNRFYRNGRNPGPEQSKKVAPSDRS